MARRGGAVPPRVLVQDQASLPLFCHDLSDSVRATQAAFIPSQQVSPRLFLCLSIPPIAPCRDFSFFDISILFPRQAV